MRKSLKNSKAKVEDTKTKAAENFNEWMRNKVNSVHYANNEEMTKAFARVQGAW